MARQKENPIPQEFLDLSLDALRVLEDRRVKSGQYDRLIAARDAAQEAVEKWSQDSYDITRAITEKLKERLKEGK